MKTIKLFELLSTKALITIDQSYKTYPILHKHLTDGEEVEIDFSGIEFMVSGFFHNAIGKLYIDFGYSTASKLLSFSNFENELIESNFAKWMSQVTSKFNS